MADPGEGARGGPPHTPICLDQTEARRAEKKFFGRPGPLLIWMTPPPPPFIERQPFMEPYLKYRLSANQSKSSRPHRLLTLKLPDF